VSKKFVNPRRDRFLNSRPTTSIETSDIAQKCKFSLAYFTPDQDAAQSFTDWQGDAGAATLTTLMEKLKEYTKQPLNYWENQRAGGGSLKVLARYGDFPKKSAFSHPAHVPHDVVWARFRLAQKVRLIGFVIPETLADKDYQDSKGRRYRYDSNTFYIVFFDKEHQFYQMEKA